MVEIKISLSEEMDDLIQKVCNVLGIKKTEYVKSLVIENLKDIQLKRKKNTD